MKSKLLLVGLLVAFASPALAQTVVTTTGTVQGTTVGGVDKFLGIPYAEPPIGDLRWKRPVPKSPIAGTIDGTQVKAACTQFLNTSTANGCRDNSSQTNGTLVGSEDCLTLSVWRPTAASVTPRKVMVWIHGGALTTGCAKDPLSEASDLALQGTSSGGSGQIVVALQYRLGPIGFYALPELQTEDPNRSVGNYGLLDQALALKWVHDNAAAFGGDPNNVTIFGESAGGFSTYILEASPIAQGLFNRVISESGMYGQAIPLQPGIGAPSGDFSKNPTAFDRGVTIASDPSLGCTDPATRVACLRGKTTAQIYPVWNTASANLGIAGGATPSIDGYVLTEQASQMIQEAPTPPKPLLLGSNANELTIFTLSQPTFANFDALHTSIIGTFGPVAGNTILSIYPDAAFSTPIQAYRRIFEDILFVCPTFGAGQLVKNKGSVSHVYHFEDPVTTLLGLGAFHGSELFYVFGNLSLLSGVGVTPDAGDTLLSDAMQTAWTSFAADGNPIATPAWGEFDPGPGNPASQGSVLTWNLDTANNLTNTFVQAITLRDGRCAELADPANNLNSDFDSFTNDQDNCPFATNSDQADAGAVGTDPADGIGDRCQCGDVSDNGIVDAGDVTLLRKALAGSTPLTTHGLSKCLVEGTTAACDIVNVSVLRRRLATLAPGISQSCAAANPA
ncbi:MAG TPA: carboxylesterase family protein [Myxococcota bacterium]|nr:carboxylesterase family protein [Myxococcota bacterium]